MQPKASVIIPVYNTEKYLVECINSVIISDNLNGIEIIFVNDGSTDNSLKVLQEYKEKHNFITIINKENAGLAAARNSGLQVAKGEYILFLDSDDFLINSTQKKQNSDENESAMQLLLNTAQQTNADVLCFNYTRKTNYSPERKAPNGVTENIDYLVQNNIYTSSACTKLTKRSVLTENNIFFEEGTLSEDILFCAKLLETKDVKIVFFNEILYFYRQREGSITNTISLKHIKDIISIIDELKRSKSKNVLCYAAFQYATLMININLSSQKIDKIFFRKMSELSYLLKYNNSMLIKIINYLIGVCGVLTTSKLISFAFKIKRRFVK